ncbi:MAG: C10 family peptidase [Bacteroidetes bacterium]|nr:C10 family peptidase [Bacteroidota bacterium]
MTIAIFLTFSAFSKKVELPAAMLAGKNFYYERASLHQVVSYPSLNLTLARVVKDHDVDLFYIFNVNNSGFILVSADDACTPVLGYSFENIYTGLSDPEAFTSLLKAYQKEVVLVRNMDLKADATISSAWAYYSDASFSSKNKPLNPANPADVLPLLTSTWDQTFPYNAMCPQDAGSPGGYGGRVPVGCVATAMSQIMYYWRWPNQGTGSHCYTPSGYAQQCADFGNTTYDWTGMNNGPSTECDPIATLSWHTGVSVNMMYGANGSGAYSSDVPGALNSYFRYSGISHFAHRTQYPGTIWHDSLQSNLDKGHPVLYEGFNPQEGHAFVFDGYQSGNYYHVNWGWSGADNGYFSITNLNPGGTTFNNNQGAIFSIVPDPAQYPVFCQGNTNLTAYDFGSIEDGSGPVLNYQNNSNCTWTIAPFDSLSSITLSFNRFDLTNGDHLNIYNGNSSASPLIGSYTGNTVPSNAVATAGSMFIEFISGSSSTSQGFEAQYNAVPAQFCSPATIVFTDPNGSFSDGSGTFQYRNNTMCKWRITPSVPVTSIMINFPVFNTEPTNDVVTLYDLVTSQQIGQFSGSPSTPPSVTANTNSVMIMFNTNSTVRGDGWQASYSSLVGIEDQGGFNNFQVYPNPASDLLNIDFNLDHSSSVIFELLNLDGITLYTEKQAGLNGRIHETINVSSFPKGVYCLRVSGESGIVNKKIVVR